jgi:hypothetical protein
MNPGSFPAFQPPGFMALQVINPLEIPNWDDLILATGKATVFHSSGWARVLRESYGYKPAYFTSFENGKISSMMPLMEVHSVLTGTRGVSLPFTDFCESISPTGDVFRAGLDAVKKYGRERGWKKVEWRGNGKYLSDAPPSSVYYNHTLELDGGEEKIFSKFKSNTRRNINKAIKAGVRVEIDDSPEAMAAYYRLHCGTRKDHGLPPQPFSFFKKVFEHMVRGGYGFVVLAYLKDTCIAGAVYFHFGKTAVYKFGASNKQHQHLRPNNLVMWEAIRECVKRSVEGFSFGRTETDNEGLLQFKRSWNPQENPVHYYKYDLKRSSFQTGAVSVKGFHNRIFEMTPIPVLRLLGSAIYKHLG